MKPDILELHPFSRTENGVFLALPVLAVECAVTPVLDEELDPYEEAALRLLDLSLSAKGIAHALCARESLVEEVLGRLADRRLAQRQKGSPWQLTSEGEDLLRGKPKTVLSSTEHLGFFFVSTLEKEVLPYFWQGDLRESRCFNGRVGKLTGQQGEAEIPKAISLPTAQFQEAYGRFQQILKTRDRVREGQESWQDAQAEYRSLPLFEELPTVSRPRETGDRLAKARVRPLAVKPTACYLTFQLIWDPREPEGYRVVSPLPLWGLDSVAFLRRFQWLLAGEHAFLEGKPLGERVERELEKRLPPTLENSEPFPVFLRKKLPRLLARKEALPTVYRDFETIYGMMQRELGLLEQEAIVGSLSRKVAEPLCNRLFLQAAPEMLALVRDQALEELSALGASRFLNRLEQRTQLQLPTTRWTREALEESLGRLPSSHGNSLPEKLLNLTVLHRYLPSSASVWLLEEADAQEVYDRAVRLNYIRIKVSHDTKRPFQAAEYFAYLQDFFPLMDCLLRADQEEDYG